MAGIRFVETEGEAGDRGEEHWLPDLSLISGWKCCRGRSPCTQVQLRIFCRSGLRLSLSQRQFSLLVKAAKSEDFP